MFTFNRKRKNGGVNTTRKGRWISSRDMAKVNSRAKGKRGELDLAKVLRDFGFEARRGQQFSGKNGDADVVGLPGIHIECKHCERTNLDEWMEQSERDAHAEFLASGTPVVPVVIHRKNRQEWRITMTLKDFLDMFGEYLKEGG